MKKFRWGCRKASIKYEGHMGRNAQSSQIGMVFNAASHLEKKTRQGGGHVEWCAGLRRSARVVQFLSHLGCPVALAATSSSRPFLVFREIDRRCVFAGSLPCSRL